MIFFLTFALGYNGSEYADEGKKSTNEVESKTLTGLTSHYLSCRKRSLKAYKTGIIEKTQFEAEIKGCKQKFPSAAIYIACKQVAFKKHSKEPEALKAQLEKCHDVLRHASFNPEDPFPFFFFHKHLFFAGAPMDASGDFDTVKIANFNCTPLKHVLSNPEAADFKFFGNHPRVFEAFRGLSEQSLHKVLGLPVGANKKGKVVKNFGKVYGDLHSSNSAVFLPTGSCTFTKKLGLIFKGFAVHFLIEQGIASPYIAAAFYRDLPSEFKSEVLVDRMIQELKKAHKQSYEAVANPKKAQTLITSFPIHKFDEEGDPFDVCQTIIDKSLVNRYLGVIQWADGSKKTIDYILLANISLLCDAGSRLANNFVE